MAKDPYQALGVSPDASDAELRSAYRHLVLLHHPDHNGGSPDAARRFEEVQEAYARVRQLRASSPQATAADDRAPKSPPRSARNPAPDPALDSRLADLERELREAKAARERAARAARAAAESQPTESGRRPSDEELGYVKTDDSFTKIFDDAVSELGDWISEHRKR